MASYTHWLLLSMRWNASVDYGSPISGWTTRMHEILNECNGDKLKATFQLQKEKANASQTN